MRRWFAMIAVFLVSCLVPAETLTMAVQRDDPELVAVFVKTYKDAGIDLSVQILPPLRCVANINSGSMIGYLFADYGITENFKESRVVRIGFGSEPLYIIRGVAWVRESGIKKWSVKEYWPSARVGVLLGVPVIRQLGELTGSKTFVEISSYQQIAKMLAADRFDMIVVPEGYLETQVDGLPIVKLDGFLGQVDYWHVLPEKFAGTVLEKRIRAAFLANRPAFERIFYGASGRTQPASP